MLIKLSAAENLKVYACIKANFIALVDIFLALSTEVSSNANRFHRGILKENDNILGFCFGEWRNTPILEQNFKNCA